MPRARAPASAAPPSPGAAGALSHRGPGGRAPRGARSGSARRRAGARAFESAASSGCPRPRRGEAHQLGEAARALAAVIAAGRRKGLLALPRWRPAFRATRSVPRHWQHPTNALSKQRGNRPPAPAPQHRGDPCPSPSDSYPTRAALCDPSATRALAATPAGA